MILLQGKSQTPKQEASGISRARPLKVKWRARPCQEYLLMKAFGLVGQHSILEQNYTQTRLETILCTIRTTYYSLLIASQQQHSRIVQLGHSFGDVLTMHSLGKRPKSAH